MYEFASGVINVLEKKVFDKLDQERMLKAPDAAAAFSVLFDTDLGEIAAEEKDIERIFEKDLENLKLKLSRILQTEEEMFWFLFLKFDALNLKLALKKTVGGEAMADIQPFPYSLEPYQKLEKQVSVLSAKKFKPGEKEEALFSEINPFVEKMIVKAMEVFSKLPSSEISSETIERLVDKTYLRLKLELAKVLSPFLEELTRLEIDIANIKNLLKKRNKEPDFAAEGNLKTADLQKLVQLKEGEISQDLKMFLEVFKLSLLLERFAKDRSETVLESGLRGFLTERVFEKVKESGVGIEKVLAFFDKKMNANNNIRLILFAKENKLPIKDIEEVLLPI